MWQVYGSTQALIKLLYQYAHSSRLHETKSQLPCDIHDATHCTSAHELVLISEGPGCCFPGKSTTCEQLSEALGFRYINVGECVAKQSLYSGWDTKFEAHIIDEDKVILVPVLRRMLPNKALLFGLHVGKSTPQKSKMQVCDALEDQLAEGGAIIDYHSCDFFPER